MMNRKALLIGVCAGFFVWMAGAAFAAAQDQAAPPAPPQAAPQARPATPPAPPRTTEPAQEPRAERSTGRAPIDAENLKIDVTITYQVGNGAPVKRSASLTVADGETASLRAGNQIAVPSTTFVQTTPKADGPSAAPAMPPQPMTSFNYRSVGLNLDARRVRVSGNKAMVMLSVEFSAVDDKTADSTRPPAFPTFSQSFSLVLENGKPLVVAQSSDFVDGVERRQSVEVKATILR
jgi:hypothetical protein